MAVLAGCGASCNSCVKANDFCETGLGGDVYRPSMLLKNFQIKDQPFLSGTCQWGDSPQGLTQLTNNWGNAPGDNAVMGCAAFLKPDGVMLNYTDFILEVDGISLDNDAWGIVFGVDETGDNYHQVHLMNSIWPFRPSDSVPGPHLKVKRTNGKPCLGTMNATTQCHDTIAYNALIGGGVNTEESQYPNGKLSSVEFMPEPYSPTYEQFPFDNTPVKLTVIVYKGEVRTFFRSRAGKLVGTWGDLDESYSGGSLGLFTHDQSVVFKNMKIVDLSEAATPLANKCHVPGATCGLNGLCEGGASDPPTLSPTNRPTFTPETCFPVDQHRAPASEFCPSPVGGNFLTIDTTSETQWEFIDQPLLTEACAWAATADGLAQTSNAWGNSPGDNTMMGCVALAVTADYTDFIAEFDATHSDNDGFGFVFGFQAGDGSHYMAMTTNDVEPLQPTDGIPGPFIKIKKTNGLPCLETMDNETSCYSTLAYTSKDGFSNEYPKPETVLRHHEYEYTHPFFVGGGDFQPRKMTLIVKNKEARVLYKTPDAVLQTESNSIRQGSRYQVAMTFDLGDDYVGGRIGIVTYAHQLVASNFKITDISDDSNLPTAYCGGSSFCDAGITGLCLGVAANDVCEGSTSGIPVDTTRLDQFEFIDDPFLFEPCLWEILGGQLAQSSNTNRAGVDYTMLGCHALIGGADYTDFMVEVDQDHDDNDGVGFTFGWKSEFDHYKAVKINDNWPDPAADSVPGPFLKIMKRRGPEFSCDAEPMNSTNDCK